MTIAEVAGRLAGLATTDAPLGLLTTYRVGGRAAIGVTVSTDAELERVREAVAGAGVPVLVVGRGSNLLVADAGFPGVAVRLAGDFEGIGIDGTRVRAGGAAALPVLARRSAAAGLTGLEWAVGVPGSVGGAVRMNAGGHGAEVAATLRRARLVDLAGGTDRVAEAPALALGYRRSAVRPHDLVAWAEFELAPGDTVTSEATIAEIVRWRRENQPGGQNAGSVFTNPPGDSAGRLVDHAGLKGLRVGTAEVSTKHANFIQADEGGSADDVRRLIDEVRRRVAAASGVELHPEIRLVGFPDTYPHVDIEGSPS